MRVTMLRAKIHRATVTRADLHYVGSLTVDRELLEASGILVGEKVSVVDIDNGERFETYIIEGEPGSGVIGVNGAAARLVSVGDLVRLLTFRQGQANLVELTLAPDAELVGRTVGSIAWPTDSALVAILREGRVLTPSPEGALEAGDELLLVATAEVEEELDVLLTRTTG